jgi:hypothetical protein
LTNLGQRDEPWSMRKFSAIVLLGSMIVTSPAFATTPNDYAKAGWKVTWPEVSPRKDCWCVIIKIEKGGKTVMCEVPLHGWPSQNCHPPQPCARMPGGCRGG